MKALQKDRTRRYPTVSEFAAEIGRYLGGDPVEAGPPSARYRVSRFLRRHRIVLNLFCSFGLTWPVFFWLVLSADKLLPISDFGVASLSVLMLAGLPFCLAVLSVLVWRSARGKHALINAVIGVVVCGWAFLAVWLIANRPTTLGLVTRANLFIEKGQYDEAANLYKQQLNSSGRGGYYVGHGYVEELLGRVYVAQKRFSEAEPLFLQAYERTLRREQERVAAIASTLADLYEAWGRPDDAAEWRARASNASSDG